MWFVIGLLIGFFAGVMAGALLVGMMDIGAEAERELDEIRRDDWQG